MEFKNLKVGTEIYGDLQFLQSGDTGPGLNRKVTMEDKKHGIEYSFDCPRLKECLAGEDLQEVAYTIKSSNGKTSKTFKSQREATIELLKFLALAHECLPETKTDSEGNTSIFYGGPSPDEVTLVDFSKN